MGTTNASTAKMVEFLERSSPGEINALRQRHQSEGRVLSSARELGSLNEAPMGKIAPAQRAAYIDLVSQSAKGLKTQAEVLINAIRQRMTLVNRTKMIGGVIATISGAIGALLVYLQVDQAGVALASALVAMLGGLATLFADYFEKAPSGIRIASAEEHGRFVEIRASLDRIERRIARDAIIVVSDQDLLEMVSIMDDYSDRVVRLSFA
ncbi:hypothetical protein DFR52_1011043 [Hoeflea marina]|uniref:SMODS and SLOG-associating 2TM effector domain-containing protein n=1 Tax=Hoeflea marina TaxID=274592 RepID=A0A317PVN9_9HYPH|nr:hypothetical protein [Hoeflea marina]PWW04346.1 hypothetical protein DFR52_1011043 [Hoeflea marina]